jgi:hypothetical protein
LKGFTGYLLIGIGTLHTLVGVLSCHRDIFAIARAGFVNAVEPEQHRIAVFWFLMSGFSLLILGHMCMWLERKLRRPVPAFVGWELLLLSAAGAVLLPISGFWLVLAVAVYVIVSGRHKSDSSDQEVTAP